MTFVTVFMELSLSKQFKKTSRGQTVSKHFAKIRIESGKCVDLQTTTGQRARSEKQQSRVEKTQETPTQQHGFAAEKQRERTLYKTHEGLNRQNNNNNML